MATYIIELPENYNWEGVKFYDASVWGTGNGGQNRWGWNGGADLFVSAPEKCARREGEWMIKVTASTPSPDPAEGLAFITRCEFKDSDNEYGVFSSNQMIPE